MHAPRAIACNPFLAQTMTAFITELTPGAARAMAEYFDAMASACRERADRIDALDAMKKRNADQIAALPEIGARALALIDHGIPVEAVIKSLADSERVPVETVAAYAKKSTEKRDKQKRQHRDIEIVRAAARGWSNGQIAAQHNLSPSTVSRIVRRQWNANG